VSGAQLGEVLEIGQVRMMKAKFPDVFESLGHLLHFSGWEEVERVPVPFVMEDAVIQPNRPIGGNEMIWKHALTSGRYLELLGPLFQVHLGGLPVSALDVHGGVLGQVGDEVALAELVDPLLDGDDLKGAESLGGLELLHVQST
jgi:hypothetical protein